MPGDTKRRTAIGKTVAQRLLENSVVSESGCWIWTGYRDREGYGRLNINHVPELAHRAAHESFAQKIPTGMDLDHTCHDPKTCDGGPTCPHRACINPAHTKPVTRSVNTGRDRSCRAAQMSNHPVHARRAAQTHCKHGHEFTPENTYRYGPEKRGRMCIKCSRIRSKKREHAR